MAYLDETGLSHLWGKITSAISSNSSSGGGTYTPPFPADAVVCYDNSSGTTGTVTLSSKMPTYCNYAAIQLKNQSWIVSKSQASNTRLHWFARNHLSSNSYARSYDANPYGSQGSYAESEGIRQQFYLYAANKTITQTFGKVFAGSGGLQLSVNHDSDEYLFDPYKIIKVVIWS